MKKHSLLVILFLVWAICLGCDDANLYSNIEEKEAVEMQAILLRQGIDCDKINRKDNLCEIRVSKNQLSEAIDILKSNGYPKDEFSDMGTMFKKEGLVSSPLEERIRYIYALSQEMAQTLSKIDGVITARVHIVLPENDPLSEYFQPSSASVFIKHLQNFDIQSHVHQVKQLVVNSVEGLSYDKVSVVPFASSVVKIATQRHARIFGIEVVYEYLPRLRLLVYGLIFFLAIAFLACGYLLWKIYKFENSVNKKMLLKDGVNQIVR